jgi:hypothetical protein
VENVGKGTDENMKTDGKPGRMWDEKNAAFWVFASRD